LACASRWDGWTLTEQLDGEWVAGGVCGPTRSRRGDEFIARGFSVGETCRRQGRDLIDYMHQAVIAWIDKTPHPSLLPPLAVPSG
jgi:hypothetical protein